MQQLPPPNWFVAFPVYFSSGLLFWLREHRSAPPQRLCFFKPVDLHLTLAFLGKLEPAEVRPVLKWLEDHCDVFPDVLSARCRELLLLPGGLRCSAIALSVEDDTGMLIPGIGESRKELLRLAGKPEDSRPVLPHVTVARPRRKLSDAEKVKMLLTSGLPENLEIHLHRPVLFTRSLDRTESLFRMITGELNL
jgi:2'-5' RNA ligase